MGAGGCVAGPAGLAATLTRTPLVLTEADSHLGLANRLLAGRARRVCLAFPIESGRASVNFAAIEAFAEREGRDFEVVQLAGTRDYAEIRAHGSMPRRLPASGSRCSSTSPNLGDVPRRLRPGRRPLGRLDLRGDGRRPAGDPRPLSRTRPPTIRPANARWMERGGAADR